MNDIKINSACSNYDQQKAMVTNGYISKHALDRVIISERESALFFIDDAVGCLMEGMDMPEEYCESLPYTVAKYYALSGGAIPTKLLADLKKLGYHELRNSIHKSLGEALVTTQSAA